MTSFLALVNLLVEALQAGVDSDSIHNAVTRLMVEAADRQMKEELSDE